MAIDQGSLRYGTGAVTTAEARNRVLRNTYWLLALSMIPTVIGAWIGVATGFTFFAGSPFMGLIVFLAVAFGFMFAINRYKDSGIGVLLLLAFTFFMGLMLSRLIGHILGFSNGAQLIMTAFGGTAIVFAAMATIATVSKRDFSSMGKWLMMGFIVIFLAAIANIWLQLPALMLTISALAVVIFSLFILYDLKRVIDGGETNYVTATLSIYISLYNVFSNLLALIGIGGGDD
jgi:modulator of FtsH protease